MGVKRQLTERKTCLPDEIDIFFMPKSKVVFEMAAVFEEFVLINHSDSHKYKNC